MKKRAKKITIIIAVAVLLAAILAVGLIFGLGSLNQSVIIQAENPTTVRKTAPTDGTTPEDHSGLDNIAYMAYVLDHQPSYHAYANNSTRSTGYEQITQTWKDYKSAELSGKNTSIMICSDLSYSALVKSASQACFAGNSAVYMRTGDKPGRESTPNEINWSTAEPTYYDKETYLKTYGEFSTELSVYAINSTTVESFGELIKNEDGTFSQTFTLRDDAACWYQYGMKTRGGLKNFPEFESIVITFTFDAKWQVLSSYCEERTWIAPGALGGINMSSNSKTTTTFYYESADFDTAHYSYFDSYFSDYVGTVIENKPSEGGKIELLDVLAGGFGKVLSADGQQFGLSLKLGETEYEGKVYLKLAELSVDAIEARLALEKSGSGKQDFYLEYANGVANAYFSDAFAMTADISKVSSSVKSFKAWIDTLVSEEEDALTVQSEGGGIDLASLLNSLKVTNDKNTVTISLNSDNLLNLGVGVDLEMLFDYSKGEEGYTYAFKSLTLNALSFNSTDINLGLGITPDGGSEIIYREASDNPADIAEFVDGVLALAKSEVYEVNVSLDGSCESIEYINGLVLNAAAMVKPSDNFTKFNADVQLNVTYGGLNVVLTADYAVNLSKGGYGDIYLTLNSINGTEYGAKVKCGVNEIIEAVKGLIAEFNSDSGVSAQAEEEATGLNVANVINTVLNLDFGAILKEIKADGEKISLTVNADEVLSALGVNLGLSLGDLNLNLGLAEGKAALKGGLPALGAQLAVIGSQGALPEVNPDDYTDLTAFVSGVHKLLTAGTYCVDIVLDGTCESIQYLSGASTQLKVLVKPDEKFENIVVNVPAFTVNYKGLTVTLSAYYTANLKELSKGNYGEVYLTLSEIGGQEIEVKAHCSIKDTISAVKELIEMFAPSTQAAAQGGANAVSGVLDTVLSLDYGAILTEISAHEDIIKLGVNADALLTAFDVDLGFEIGTVNLALALENGAATLNGSVESLGLNLTVGGSNDDVPAINAGEYADVTSYINGVKTLLLSKTYAVSLNLDGTCESIEYIKGVTASANALVSINGGFNEIQVYVPALSASYQGLNVVLDVYYTLAVNGGGYGNVYLHVSEIGGQDVDVKVKCNISEVITAVKQIIDMYSEKTPAPAVLAEEAAADDKIANIIDTVVSINYKAVIDSFTANNTGINACINADELLKALNIPVGGIQPGSVSVSVNLGSDNKLTLGGKAEKLGLTLGLGGSQIDIPELDLKTYADLVSYVNGVYNLLNSTTYNVNIGFTGSKLTLKEGAEPIDLTGLEVQIPAQVKLSRNFKDITVNAPVTVSYNNLTVKATLYYTVNLDNGYGDIYLTLNSIGEDELNVKVYCNIDNITESVKQLIALFTPDENPEENTEDEEKVEKTKLTVAEIIAKVVSLDFKAIINELTADNTGVNLSVSADEILKALNVDVKGIILGNVDLTLKTDSNNCATLTGSVKNYGISLNLSGNNKDIPAFDGNGYFDLNELVILVSQAVEEAQAIIEQKNVVFALDTTLTVDGVAMRVDGNGQVDWSNGKIRVAVAADLTITEGGQSETLKLKLVYDEDNLTVSEGEQVEAFPLVRLTVNNLGLEIYRKDLDDTKGGLNEIIGIVNTIVNTFKTNNGGTPAEEPENGVQVMSEEDAPEEGSSENKLAAVITKVFEEIQKVTIKLVSAEETESKQLVVAYAQNAVLTLGADGGLNLKLNVKNNNGTDIINIDNASVRAAGETDKFAELKTEFAKTEEEIPVYTFYSAEEQGAFTKAVYDYAFAVLKDLTVKNLLNSDTYTVTVVLDGKNSGIEALKDVYVNAELCYTEIAKADKLVEMYIELTVGGTAVNANAYYYNDTLYISVNEINGTKLANTVKTQTVDGVETDVYDGLKIRAGVQDIYLAADAVVKLIKNENLIPLINLFISEQEDSGEEVNEENTQPSVQSETANTLSGILNALLSLEVKFAKEEGLNTLVLNADALLEELDLGFKLGTVTVKVNPQTHSVNASAVYGENESWLDVSAEAVNAENTVRGVAPVAGDYIDISFVKTLLNDVNTTLGSLGTKTETADGKQVKKPDVRISLTGDLKAEINYSVVKATIPINDITLTVGLDEQDKFFFSLTGELENRSAEIGISLGSLARISQAWKISVTYSNGYVTMGRELGTNSEKYKVMTIEYLLDNLLDKNNSPVRWLLGTSDTVWGLICDNVKLPLNSGLTEIKDYYLYETAPETPENPDVTEEDAKAVFVLSQILNGMGVKISDYTSTFGNNASSVVSQLSLTDNYYAFDLDLSSLIGNTFSKIYAAIVRNNNGGLKGVKAYAVINDKDNEVVKLTVNLAGGMITAETADRKHAVDYYKVVTEANPGIKFTYDDGTKKFGCYSTQDYSYDYSEYNTEYVLNVYDFGGADYNDCPVNTKANILNEKHANVTLKSGSVVHVLENETWLDEEQTLKLIYVDENENDLGLSFTLKADTNIYMMIVGENKVHFYDKDRNACNVVDSEDNSRVLYAGDALPDPQSVTVEQNGVNYTFAGWYTEGYERLVTSVQTGVDEYFAKYVSTNVTEDNGVTYTFVRNAQEAEGGHYVVTKFNSNNVTDGVNYADDINTLVLANVIEGFKVTEITANALASSNNYYLQNVVVPYNITTVGERAFLDNYGMKSVVFLADKVTMSGSVDGKNYPFYGCSVSNGGNSTNLNVYYNSVSPETQWNHFRDGNNYIGVGNAGGSLNGAGSWGYVKFTVPEGYEMAEFGYADGLVAKPVNENYLDTVKSDIITKLNGDTSTDGVIYKYSVEVEEIVAEGIHCVTVTISEDIANAWNKLVLEGSDIKIEKTSEIEVVNGAYFVKPNATVTVNPASGNEGLTRLTVYGDTDKSTVLYDSGTVSVTASLTFIMQNKFALAVAERANLPITEITLKSVTGLTDENGDSVNEIALSIDEGKALDYDVTSEGYTFLGWAYENSSNLLEFETTVQHRVYYAVWAVDREEVNSVALENGAFTADVVTEKAVSVYGWYAYETNNGTVKFDKAVTPATLTTSTTLVYPRMVFTLSYTMTGLSSKTNYYFVREDTTDGKTSDATATGSSYSSSFNMLEGTDLKYWWTYKDNGEVDANKVLRIDYFDENGAEKTLYFRIKNGTSYYVTVSWSTCLYEITGAFRNSDVPGTAGESNSLPVAGNLELNFAAKS